MSQNTSIALITCPQSNDFGSSYYYAYVHPIIELYGIFNGIIATLVLAQKEVRSSGPFFHYELIFTLQSLIGTIMTLPLTLTKCGYLCSTSNQLWARNYEKLTSFFIGQAILVADGLIQVSITFQIYFTLSPRFFRLSQVSPLRVIAVIDLIGILCGLSVYFVTNINSYTCFIPNELVQTTIYYISIASNSLILLLVAQFVLLVANYTILIVLVVMNLLLYNELRKFMNRKIVLMGTSIGLSKMATRNTVGPMDKSVIVSSVVGVGAGGGSVVGEERRNRQSSRNESESKRKTLIMVLWVSVAFCMGRFLTGVTSAFSIVAGPTSVFTVYFTVIAIVWGVCVFATHTLILYKTNKIFKKKFRQLILRRKVERAENQ